MRSTGGWRWWTSRAARGAVLAAYVMGMAGPGMAGDGKPPKPDGGHEQGEPLLRPRWVPAKEDEIVIDPTRAVAGVFVIKFAEGSHVRLTAGGLIVDLQRLLSNPEELRRLDRAGLTPGAAVDELRNVAAVLADARATLGFRLTPALRPPGFVYDPWAPEADKPFRAKDELEQRSGEELADLDLYYVAYSKDFHDVSAQKELMNQLNQFKVVEQVYVAAPSEGAQAGPTPNVTWMQGYLGPAPAGLDAVYAWTKPGGRGDGVRLIDVEFDWVTDHEDFPPESQKFWGGRPACAYDGGPNGQSEHGTAVMGVIAAPANGFGVTGLASNVQWGLSSVCRPFDYVWAAMVATFSGENWPGRAHNVVVANAIQAAADQLRPGDVIVVEQHAPGPGTGVSCPAGGNCPQWEWVAMEHFQESFDVIRHATARGVIVVEAAGNGTQNLDTAPYGTRFAPNVRHSGALFVGGSGAGDNMPNGSTNSSRRIDVHAWGDGVTTLGYSTGSTTPPFESTRPIRRFYTDDFGGTSSASAIVAGAVASLQGARRATGRPPLSPIEMTRLLRATGSPQLGTPESVMARPIGVQPNLRAAVDVATASGGGFTGTGFYTIRSKSSGKVLDIDISWFHGQDNGQSLVQWDFHGGLNQQFEIWSDGAGAYFIFPRHTRNKVLDVTAVSTADGARLQQWATAGGANQRFRIEPVGGFYRIVAVHSGKVLDIPGFSRDNGTVVQQFTWNGGDNQLFEFAPAR